MPSSELTSCEKKPLTNFTRLSSTKSSLSILHKVYHHFLPRILTIRKNRNFLELLKLFQFLKFQKILTLSPVGARYGRRLDKLLDFIDVIPQRNGTPRVNAQRDWRLRSLRCLSLVAYGSLLVYRRIDAGDAREGTAYNR